MVLLLDSEKQTRREKHSHRKVTVSRVVSMERDTHGWDEWHMCVTGLPQHYRHKQIKDHVYLNYYCYY